MNSPTPASPPHPPPTSQPPPPPPPPRHMSPYGQYPPPPPPGPGMPMMLSYWNGSQYPPPPGMGPYAYPYQYQPPTGPSMPPYWNGSQYPPPTGPGMQPYQYPPAIGYLYNYPIPPPNKFNSSSFIKGVVLGKLIYGTDVADALIGNLPFLS